jgi:hypothetical protein
MELEELVIRIEKVKGSCHCEPCFASVEMNFNLNTRFGKSLDRLLLQNSQRLFTKSRDDPVPIAWVIIIQKIHIGIPFGEGNGIVCLL